MAGFPPQLLDAYRRFQESLIVHNTIAGGIGKGFTRRCGIPQGCALSMLFTALIMRPWVLMAKARGCFPRILADDIMLIATGKGFLRRFATTLNLSHHYLLDMGAKIAHGKSLNFASTKPARPWLAVPACALAGGAILLFEHTL